MSTTITISRVKLTIAVKTRIAAERRAINEQNKFAESIEMMASSSSTELDRLYELRRFLKCAPTQATTVNLSAEDTNLLFGK